MLPEEKLKIPLSVNAFTGRIVVKGKFPSYCVKDEEVTVCDIEDFFVTFGP